jgi:hypothetical protein
MARIKRFPNIVWQFYWKKWSLYYNKEEIDDFNLYFHVEKSIYIKILCIGPLQMRWYANN